LSLKRNPKGKEGKRQTTASNLFLNLQCAPAEGEKKASWERKRKLKEMSGPSFFCSDKADRKDRKRRKKKESSRRVFLLCGIIANRKKRKEETERKEREEAFATPLLTLISRSGSEE